MSLREHARKGVATQTHGAEFEREQEHLSQAHATLRAIAQSAHATLRRVAADAAADKVSMGEELFFDRLTDSMEMFVELESLNQVVDAYNIQASAAADELSRAARLLEQPYFAKVVLRYPRLDGPRAFYIGTCGMTGPDARHFIVDWRSPVAETYYNQDNGRTSYEANGRRIECDLELRRQFDLERDELRAFFDTTVAIEDPLLLRSLQSARNDKMQAITTTIQREQNAVIRHPDVPALLVEGIAGSGKTSIMMQRIAYLFYRNRDTLEPDQVVLVTPNTTFERYIADVLPDLGERNPRTLTWDAFMARMGQDPRRFAKASASLEDLQAIERAISGVTVEPGDYRAVKLPDGRDALSARTVANAAARLEHLPAGSHRSTLLVEALTERLTSRIGQLAATDRAQDEMLDLPDEDKWRLFDALSDPDSDDETLARTRIYLTDLFAPAFEAVRAFAWLDVDRIGRRLLGKETLSAAEWLYCKVLLTGASEPQVRYCMVDEVQDYDAAQLAALARYFPRAHFMLLGDENQAIRAGTATFAQVERVFAATHGSVGRCALQTSYRSSPEVTAVFAKLLPAGSALEPRSVQPPGLAVSVLPCETDDACRDALLAAVDAWDGPGLCAVVARNRAEFNYLRKLVGPRAAPVRSGDALPERGAVLIELRLAKGLEFDAVVVPDCSARAFPAGDDLARRRLYTTVSRATRRLTLIGRCPLSPLL